MSKLQEKQWVAIFCRFVHGMLILCGSANVRYLCDELHLLPPEEVTMFGHMIAGESEVVRSVNNGHNPLLSEPG